MANTSPTDYKKLFLQAEEREKQAQEREKQAQEREKQQRERNRRTHLQNSCASATAYFPDR
ncbi:unnamed protein product [Penicillium roqueforti FM164]|uniref:Uncharacterized protein n=1 Tax=Penicillium roqueforti (strain FM164) TaxID=1365484 RepID=W6R8I7_PENRF|nr:unnamed protein product [Penicillium roqueforti FM164]